MLPNSLVGKKIRAGHDFGAGFAANFERALARQRHDRIARACCRFQRCIEKYSEFGDGGIHYLFVPGG